MDDEEKSATEEERAAAAALADGLDGRPGGDPGDLEAALMIRSAAGKAPRLGEVAARAVVRQAILAAGKKGAAAARSPRARFTTGIALAAVAAATLFMFARQVLDGGTAQLPARLRSRSAGMLVPGPFPVEQTAAQRLDLVTADRLVAFREVGLYSYAARRK